MKSGPSTDILSGRPKELIDEETAASSKAATEKNLREKMDFLGLTRSIDGKKLISLVQGLLEKRIDELLKEDLQSQAYIKVLTELGIKETLANKAAERWVHIKTRKE